MQRKLLRILTNTEKNGMDRTLRSSLLDGAILGCILYTHHKAEFSWTYELMRLDEQGSCRNVVIMQYNECSICFIRVAGK